MSVFMNEFVLAGLVVLIGAGGVVLMQWFHNMLPPNQQAQERPKWSKYDYRKDSRT